MEIARLDELTQQLAELVTTGAVGAYMVPLGMVRRRWPDDKSDGVELAQDPKPPYSDEYFAAPKSMRLKLSEPAAKKRKLVTILDTKKKKK